MLQYEGSVQKMHSSFRVNKRSSVIFMIEVEIWIMICFFLLVLSYAEDIFSYAKAACMLIFPQRKEHLKIYTIIAW